VLSQCLALPKDTGADVASARLGFSLRATTDGAKMTRTELIIQLLKLAIGLAFGAYFVWWSLEVLDRLTPEDQVRVIDAGPQADPRACNGRIC
jgi:hypothetical protein